MDAILEIAKLAGFWSLRTSGVSMRRTAKTAGALGARGTQRETKTVVCGESGALVNDPSLSERAEIVREKGTNRSTANEGRSNSIPGWTSAPRTAAERHPRCRSPRSARGDR